MKIQKKTLQLLEKVTRGQVEREFHAGLPACTGFLHQPKRPKIVGSEVKK